MLRIIPPIAIALCFVAPPAFAQRVGFERRMAMPDGTALDVRTIRGRVEITVGQPGQIVVQGAATVRVGWDVPRDADAIARAVAANPPVTQDAHAIHLAPPADAAARRAVTVSYQVRVPPGTRITAASESGAMAIRGAGPGLTVRTQSGAIDLAAAGGSVDVTSGSGDVTIDDVSGPLAVTTRSSAVTARGLQSSVRVETQSGAVDLVMTGAGDADVQTGSSAITIRSARRGVHAVSRSGRVSLAGHPGAPWTVETGSAAIDVDLAADAAIALDAATRSGGVVIDDLEIDGTTDKRIVQGRVAGGGPLVHLRTRSGSIRVQRAQPAHR